MNRFLLVDFIDKNGYYAYTDRLDKIESNLDQVKYFKNNIQTTKATKTTPFLIMGVVGRWIIIYRNNGTDESGTTMYFLDYRLEVSNNAALKETFAPNNLNAIRALQEDHEKDFLPEMDIIELVDAEPWEMVIKRNFFACDNDERTLDKAKVLGVLPAIENLKPGDTVKVVIADERISTDSKTVLNIYALIHFGGHNEKSKNENGFSYIKLYDFQNTETEIKTLHDAILNIGGKFDL